MRDRRQRAEDRRLRAADGKWKMAEFIIAFFLFDKKNYECFKQSMDQLTKILFNDTIKGSYFWSYCTVVLYD